MSEEKKLAVIILETEVDRHGEYIPCIVKEGEQGFYPTNWRWGTDLEVAKKLADDYNARLGISKEEAMRLTLESMRGGARKMKEMEARLEGAEEPPAEMRCPHCFETIKELRYKENGYMRISDHAVDGKGMDAPERVHYCPECGEEIEFEDLEKAGVF